MNYHFSLVAKGLRTEKSNGVDLIVDDISNPFYSKIRRAIEDKARLNDYQHLICRSDDNEEKELQLFSLLFWQKSFLTLIGSDERLRKNS